MMYRRVLITRKRPVETSKEERERRKKRSESFFFFSLFLFLFPLVYSFFLFPLFSPRQPFFFLFLHVWGWVGGSDEEKGKGERGVMISMSMIRNIILHQLVFLHTR